VRQLDAKLPDKFRHGVCFNGAGVRALGMAGRSLHDVLEDTAMAVASLRSAKPGDMALQREGGDEGLSKMLSDVRCGSQLSSVAEANDKGAHSSPPAAWGSLMRDFMASTGKNAKDILADANIFVLSSGLCNRCPRRKATQERAKDNRREGVSAAAPPCTQVEMTRALTPWAPAPSAMAMGSPPQVIQSAAQRQYLPASPAEEGPTTTTARANITPPPVRIERDRLALAPLALLKNDYPRLPPICFPSHGDVMSAHGPQILAPFCTTDQGHEQLMQELHQVRCQAAAAALLREQMLLLHLLQVQMSVDVNPQ